MSLEERYDEVRQLIAVGKEKGYLLYDEVNEMLPSEITSSEDLDDLFNAFGSAGIEVVDSDKAYRADKDFDRDGSEDGPELDLTPGALDKTNDPVRMYLREMGTVPLLTREGEVAIAKRIERGKLAVIKSISRTPTIAKRILIMGDQLRAGERTIRELVIFSDEEITDEVIQERAAEVLGQIEQVRKARANYAKALEKVEATPKKDKRKFRRVRFRALRAWIEVSRRIREIEFTETIKRRLVEEVKDSVDAVQRVQRELEGVDRQLNPKVAAKTKAPKLKEEDKRNLLKRQKDIRVQVKQMVDDLEETPERLRRTIDVIGRGEWQAEIAKKELVEANLRLV
ncbi:MAG TPA: RNA polymerase sigma factor region1.1 domain-containing protein, partial [Vicinamibacterales bacterium]|nr:RNA polymerase sigma factor region1.1 domain-containing protein [Vicinamibacterales bacterium]